ncbi:MAG: LamG-like jellyroll fold domain-containing protein [Bacteroidota bacterium]
METDRTVHALDAEQQVNAFFHWPGSEPIEGLQLELPPEWTVERVQAVYARASVPVEAEVQAPAGTRPRAVTAEPLRGAQTFVVSLTVGARLGYQEVRVAPLLPGRAERAAAIPWQAYVREALPVGRNRAFHLDGETPPVALRRRALPSLDPREPLTMEFWLRTLGVHETVLSTWDGDEDRPYPLEFVVDGHGRLAVYRGRPGHHEKMQSDAPVADGAWHHVALVNDPLAERARLFVDGLRVDSLQSSEQAGMLNTMSLALGGRPERPGAMSSRRFSGYLDEFRLWSAARPAVDIRRTMRVPLEEAAAGVFRLGFDAPLPADVLVTVPDAVLRVPSNLSFTFPVEALEASVQQGIVTLTWQTKNRRATEFQVERSSDGQRFEAVGTVRAAESVGESVDGSVRFAHTDLPPEGRVLYYRVRQVTPGEPERVSGAFKLGLGAEAATALIVGNSPNPFQASTTITYELARSVPVRLSVWDVAGTRVASLVDETLPAGRHEYRFTADGLPSGIYFVRLETPDGSAAHKLTLTR